MRALLLVIAAVSAIGPARAQVRRPAPVIPIEPPAYGYAPPSPYDRAPWWMGQPIIASTGQVRTELTSNRASFSATFQAIDRSAAEATRAAAEKVRALSAALTAYGADKVVVQSSVSIRPLYDQYRNKEGVLVDNDRADRVARYQADIRISVRVREVALVQRVYATVLNARPTSTDPVYFSLEPENEAKTALFAAAVKDARRRALLAAEASGARLGGVKLIDPTGRACQTDVLVAGAPRSYGAPGYGSADASVQEVIVTAQRRSEALEAPAPPPPPPPSAEAQAPVAELAIQPSLQTLQATACVIYALGG